MIRRRPLTSILCFGILAAGLLTGVALYSQERASSSETVKSLLEKLSFAFSQPKKDAPIYKVTVEGGGEASVVICQETVAGWKASDGSDVKYVYMWSPITPMYSKDVDVPPELTLAMAKLNDNIHWLRFSLYTDERSGDWMALCSCDMFLRGASAETFTDHLYVLQSGVRLGKKQLLPFMAK